MAVRPIKRNALKPLAHLPRCEAEHLAGQRMLALRLDEILARRCPHDRLLPRAPEGHLPLVADELREAIERAAKALDSSRADIGVALDLEAANPRTGDVASLHRDDQRDVFLSREVVRLERARRVWSKPAYVERARRARRGLDRPEAVGAGRRESGARRPRLTEKLSPVLKTRSSTSRPTFERYL